MNHGRIKLKKLEIFITKIVRNFQNADSKGMKSLLNDSSVISKIISTTNLVPFTIISRLDEEILFLFLIDQRRKYSDQRSLKIVIALEKWN